jgi:hypothetical protein
MHWAIISIIALNCRLFYVMQPFRNLNNLIWIKYLYSTVKAMENISPANIWSEEWAPRYILETGTNPPVNMTKISPIL